jgi:hypothetical protein
MQEEACLSLLHACTTLAQVNRDLMVDTVDGAQVHVSHLSSIACIRNLGMAALESHISKHNFDKQSIYAFS